MLDLATRHPRHSFYPVDAEASARENSSDWTPSAPSKDAALSAPGRPCCTVDSTETALADPRLPTSSLESDARRWVVLIQARDESGLRQFHAAFRRKVFGCALGIVRHEEIANEIVSTSFMQVWTSAAGYDPQRGSVVAWLLLITRSRSLDALRHARLVRAREISVDDDDSLQELPGDASLEPQSRLEQRSRDWRLRRALLRLSPIQRQVLSLTTLEGLSQDEASRHLNLPLGTIKSHARRAMAALRARCEAIGLAADQGTPR